MSNYNLAVQIGITLKRKWAHPNCKELIGATEMTPEIKKYLSSSRWQKNRIPRLEQDDWKCQGHRFQGSKSVLCLSEKNLVVHHKTYARIRNELLEDMITFCKSCHLREHIRIKREKRQLSIFQEFQLIDFHY